MLTYSLGPGMWLVRLQKALAHSCHHHPHQIQVAWHICCQEFPTITRSPWVNSRLDTYHSRHWRYDVHSEPYKHFRCLQVVYIVPSFGSHSWINNIHTLYRHVCSFFILAPGGVCIIHKMINIAQKQPTEPTFTLQWYDFTLSLQIFQQCICYSGSSRRSKMACENRKHSNVNINQLRSKLYNTYLQRALLWDQSIKGLNL